MYISVHDNRSLPLAGLQLLALVLLTVIICQAVAGAAGQWPRYNVAGKTTNCITNGKQPAALSLSRQTNPIRLPQNRAAAWYHNASVKGE
jgi:hypothetical protein